MRFNKSKWKMLYLGLGPIPDRRADREENSLRAACRDGLGGSCKQKAEKRVSSVYSQSRKPNPCWKVILLM